LHFHFDEGEPSKGLDIHALLKEHTSGTHVYYCGPAGFMSACAQASAHWPQEAVHCEHFKAPETAPRDLPDGAFEVFLVKSGVTLQVGPDQTIVRAIELTGRRVPTSCLSGLCGACKVGYVDGDVDHRDYILNDDERSHCLTVCVSRAKGKSLSLDL
jgi:vanillate O-demethylase ferredoxin subunit